MVVGRVVVVVAVVGMSVVGAEVGAGHTVPVIWVWIQALAVDTREYTPMHPQCRHAIGRNLRCQMYQKKVWNKNVYYY